MRSILVILASATLLTACGATSPTGFSETFPDNRASDIQTVLARLRAGARAAREDAPVAVGITSAPAKLFAFDVRARHMLWTRPVDAKSPPRVAGRFVVVHETSGVVVRDLATGQEVLRPEGGNLSLVGASGEGDVAAVVLSTGGGVGARSKLVLVDGDSIAWEREATYAMGVPALAAGMVFLPWGNQNLSVIDVRTSDEIARVRVRDDVVGHAIADRGAVYLGQNGVFRLTPRIARGTKAGAAYFAPAPRELPGRPGFLPNAYEPPPSPQSAVHRVRLAWRPAGEGERVALEGDSLYLVFYRLLFALEPAGAGARFVYQHPRDLVGAAAQPGGVVIADDGGTVTFVQNDGARTSWTAEMGVRPSVVTFRLGTFTPPGAPTGAALPLGEQLLAAARSTDARLVPARNLAVRILAALDQPEAVGSVIALCEDRGAPPAVRSAACASLSDRASGPDTVLHALERHAAFLQGTTAPPVGALAQAAARMRERRAVPLLIAHLEDPSTPVEELPGLVSALRTLGDAGAAGPLADFLRLYHADEPSEHMINALGIAAETLAALRGPAARETLEEIASDPLSMEGVRGRAQRAIASLSTASGASAR